MKRMVSAALAAAALAGCATAPTAATVAAPTPAAPADNGEGLRLAALLARAGQADAPTRAMIEQSFGSPDIARQDGAGVALTYRLQSCALLLVFAADARSDMRLAQAHATARRAGEAAPAPAQCGAEAAARRR